MTMQHPTHPDDERLAALAGGDADATADVGLRAHVSACDRCGPMVAELRQLRTALGELPDLVPSRPLQLIPPAPAAREATGTRGWLRRLAAPMIAGGAGLVLVGAIGTSGVMSSFQGMGGAAQVAASAGNEAAAPSLADDNGQADSSAGEYASESPRLGRSLGVAGASVLPGETATPPQPTATRDKSAEDRLGLDESAAQFSPWAVVLLVGVVLLFAGAAILVMPRLIGP